MSPLRRNRGAYCGERIHAVAVDRALSDAAELAGASVERLPVSGGGDLLVLKIATGEDPRHRLYLSSGIHGDEPAGPLALLELLRENQWPAGFELWLCPMINPEAFDRNTREDPSGFDLNRDYLHRRRPRIRTHTAWLEQAPRFDCGIHLHEDWEAVGFYLYELNPRRRSACSDACIHAVRAVCPIDESEWIDGRPARGGILQPELDPDGRQDWPEAFFMVQDKTDISYTLESPSDFPLPIRVEALKTGVRTIIREIGS